MGRGFRGLDEEDYCHCLRLLRWAWKMKCLLLLSCLKRTIELCETIVLGGTHLKLQNVDDTWWENIFLDNHGECRFAGQGQFKPFSFDKICLGGIVIEEFGDMQAITTGGVSDI